MRLVTISQKYYQRKIPPEIMFYYVGVALKMPARGLVRLWSSCVLCVCERMLGSTSHWTFGNRLLTMSLISTGQKGHSPPRVCFVSGSTVKLC